jgi:hypothetical protein
LQNKSKEVTEVNQAIHNDFCFCEPKKLKFSTKNLNHVGVGVNSKYYYIQVEAEEKDVQKSCSYLTEQMSWIFYKSDHHILDIRGSVHHSIIHIANPTRYNSVSKFISYLYEAQHVLGDTPPIIRSLKLH